MTTHAIRMGNSWTRRHSDVLTTDNIEKRLNTMINCITEPDGRLLLLGNMCLLQKMMCG
jgi:hypothetical protein